MKSPVTNSLNTSLLEEISTSVVIEQYKKQFDIDVNRFFKDVENIQIYECNDTNYRFYFPFSAAGDEDFYADLQVKYANYYRTSK